MSSLLPARPLLRPGAVAVAAIGLFAVVGVRHLDSVPMVYEDEPWQASTAYKLATSGVFGSDLFAGFYHMDERYYGFMPLHPLVESVVFRVFGVGLVQARLEVVCLSLLTLGLTFALGARLFGAWVGAVAVVLLVVVRWTGLTYVQLTGIAFVDFARIARYDPLVPVLGLAALHVYVSARRAVSWRVMLTLYMAAGLLAGLAGLAHLYGLFWVVALLVLATLDGGRRWAGLRWAGVRWAGLRWAGLRRAGPWWAGLIGVAALVPWLPYAAYVSDLPDWRAQTAIYANRFELLSPAWYADNVAQEFHRYGPGLGAFGATWLLRPGWWLVALGTPVALAALAVTAFRARRAPHVTLPVTHDAMPLDTVTPAHDAAGDDSPSVTPSVTPQSHDAMTPAHDEAAAESPGVTVPVTPHVSPLPAVTPPHDAAGDESPSVRPSVTPGVTVHVTPRAYTAGGGGGWWAQGGPREAIGPGLGEAIGGGARETAGAGSGETIGGGARETVGARSGEAIGGGARETVGAESGEAIAGGARKKVGEAVTESAAMALVVPALLFPLLFALFIRLKLVNYTLIELPLFALALAWGLVQIWQRMGRARPLLAVFGVAVALEGGWHLAQLEIAARTATPYPVLIHQVRQLLPAGARVLGLHTYWIGLEDVDYRSFLVPLNWADEGLPLDEALSRVAPDVVLMDPRLRAYFAAPEVASDRARLQGWLEAHAARLIGSVDDQTYGLIEVYRVQGRT